MSSQILFLIELAVNMYAYWLWDFWCVCNNADGTKWSLNGWNCFDFIIVLVGWLDQLNLISGPLKLLRLMRAFRVFRLFKRIKSLQKIIVSLGRAVPGMINAMVIMLIGASDKGEAHTTTASSSNPLHHQIATSEPVQERYQYHPIPLCLTFASPPVQS